MCNSANHSPSCTCGFGGQGHLGQRTGFYSAGSNQVYSNSKPIYDYTYASFVTPNAHCPVCGAEVFFYQSESGSRIFFDELGPPWSKHPCTDKQRTKIQSKVKSENFFSEKKQYHWLKNGWEPFILQEKHAVHNDFVAITGDYKGVEKTFYFKNNVIFVKNKPIQKKIIDKYSFEMSTFVIENDNQVFEEIYNIYSDLRVAHQKSQKKIYDRKYRKIKSVANVKKKSNAISPKKETNTTFSLSKKPEQQIKKKRSKPKERFKTIMELAFEQAK